MRSSASAPRAPDTTCPFAAPFPIPPQEAVRRGAVPQPEQRKAVGEHMDLRKLKTLIDLVSESNISELEITEADGKVRIVKSDPNAVVMTAAPLQHAAAPAPA